MVIIVKLPEQCKKLAQVVADFARRQLTQSAHGPVDAGPTDIESLAAQLGQACERAVLADHLSALAIDAEQIRVDGVLHTRTVRGRGSYYSCAGVIEVECWLYRVLATTDIRINLPTSKSSLALN